MTATTNCKNQISSAKVMSNECLKLFPIVSVKQSFKSIWSQKLFYFTRICSSYQLAQLSQIKHKPYNHVVNCLPQLLPKYTNFIRSLWTVANKIILFQNNFSSTMPPQNSKTKHQAMISNGCWKLLINCFPQLLLK